jgi:hypothetical protein
MKNVIVDWNQSVEDLQDTETTRAACRFFAQASS